MPARGNRISSPIRPTPMVRSVESCKPSQQVQATGSFASRPASKPGSSMSAFWPARANQSAAKVEGAVELCARSFSALHAASMSACSAASDPKSFTLPLISKSSALGGSMLTHGVNRCACRHRRSRLAFMPSGPPSAGNTTAYHRCLGRERAGSCWGGGGGETAADGAAEGRRRAVRRLGGGEQIRHGGGARSHVSSRCWRSARRAGKNRDRQGPAVPLGP